MEDLGKKLKLTEVSKPVGWLEEVVPLTEIRNSGRKVDFLGQWWGVQVQSELKVTFEWKCAADNLKCTKLRNQG